MIAIDTNVLVRIIVEDKQQPKQTQIARELVLNVLEALANNSVLILQNRLLFNMAVALFKDSKTDLC